MTNTTKAITAAATAAALAAGSYFAFMAVDTDDSVYVPDIYVPDIYVPEIPVVEVPVVEVYVPTIPVVNVKDTSIKEGIVKEVPVETDIIKEGIVKEVPVETDIIKECIVKEVPVETDIIKSVPIYKVTVSDISVKDVSVDHISAVNSLDIKPVEVEDYNKSIQENMSFYSRIKNLFKDRKVLFSDKNIKRENKLFKKWIAAFEKYQKYDIKFVPMQDNLKIIAEIHVPINFDVLNKNLEFYASKGYNGVLVTFGYENETTAQLVDVIHLIKSKNMKAFISYSGPESDTHSLFSNIDILSDKIKALAKEADGIILGWRRTSLHMYTQDKGFTNFIMALARSVNPNICVIGEAFYGETRSKTGNVRNLEYNIPKNSSGVLIVGFGYNRIAVENVLQNMLSDIKGYNRLALILGDRPYYNTRLNTNKSFSYNFEIKERLAKRWIKAGCNGVVVLHGDGSDGMYNPKYTDNLGNTLY